jgi:hypothetical protein
MQRNSTIATLVVVLVLSLATGTSLRAAEQPAPKAPRVAAEVGVQNREALRRNQMRLPIPEIREFRCESLSEGYNLMLFGGSPGCADCRINVSFAIFARSGLSKFVIRFRDQLLHEENYLGPPVTSRSCRVLRLDLSPFDPPRSGYYNLDATVTDRRGQSTTRSIRLRVDMERPTITAISPADGQTIYADGGSATVTFLIDARDDFSGIKAVWMGGYAGSTTDTTAPFRITFTNVRIGDTGFDVQVVDNEGNVRSDYTSVHVRPRPAMMSVTD